MNLNNIYSNLTGVDLNEQRKINDERAKGYFGEFQVFQEIFKGIESPGKILMNLEIPGTNAEDTEIDLLYLHESGIYVFEIKNYKGIIYGKVEDDHWTQYFKTVKNNVFYNPVKQNEGHIKALKALIKKDVPIHSFIVFTNPEAELRITGDESSVTVCFISAVCRKLNVIANNSPKTYDIEQLNRQYEFLLPYSKVIDATVPLEDDPVTLPVFLEMLSKTRDEFAEQYRQESIALEDSYQNKRKAYLRRSVLSTLIAIGVAVVIAVTSVAAVKVSANKEIQQYKAAAESAEDAKNAAQAETEDMRKNFTHAASVAESGYDIADGVIKASNVSIATSTNVNNSVVLNGTISIKSELYGFKFAGSKVIVQLNDDSVKEYDLPTYNNRLGFLEYIVYYNQSVSLSSPGKELTLPDLNKEDIKYIKLRGITLCQFPTGGVLRNDIELELYSK